MAATNDLFEVPPDEFVAARNALVKELRGRGQADAAREVAALRKPTPVVWAVNRVARREGARIEALLETTRDLQKAQGAHGAPERLRDAMKAHRGALAALGEAGARALDEAKITRTQAVQRRFVDTVQGAAIADVKALRAGTLDREYDAPGFGALLGAAEAAESVHATHVPKPAHTPKAPAAAKATAAPKAATEPRSKEDEARARKEQAAAERAAKAEARRREAEERRAKERAARERKVAEHRAAQAAQRAKAARTAADRARAAADEAEAAARAAEEEASSAAAEAERLK